VAWKVKERRRVKEACLRRHGKVKCDWSVPVYQKGDLVGQLLRGQQPHKILIGYANSKANKTTDYSQSAENSESTSKLRPLIKCALRAQYFCLEANGDGCFQVSPVNLTFMSPNKIVENVTGSVL
jgi:hypothetical protein